MEAEQLEILNFIRQTTPFDGLPQETQARIAASAEVAYYRAGSTILEYGAAVHDLYLVRSGAVEIYRRNGELYNRLSEGSLFGQLGLLMNNRVRLPARALEDTLLYCIPEPVFNELFEQFELFADFVEIEDRTRLRQAVSRREDANELMTAKVLTLVQRDPVVIGVQATAQQACQKMSEESVSSLLIVNDTAENRENTSPMAGIITDRDIRNRLVTPGLDYSTPVAQIMSTE